MNKKTKAILDFIMAHPLSSSTEIFEGVENAGSYATVKRNLNSLKEYNFIKTIGKGRATKYKVSDQTKVLLPLNLDNYFKEEVDYRNINNRYNFQLIHVFNSIELFYSNERDRLQQSQNLFLGNVEKMTKNEFNLEMERLAIDLSWKSSQIEGNTYSLLETERLLKEKETAAGKTKDEAVMLLNHKLAIDFIQNTPGFLDPLTLTGIVNIHTLLTKELPIDRNIRKRIVGISGTNYKPLDNEFQIKEALKQLIDLVNSKNDVFEKALLLLAFISYIQPFSDGNKRTARIISNAILTQHKHCPLSFRTVDSMAYKMAMLLFYEQNNISALKQIFIEQYEFAVNTYF